MVKINKYHEASEAGNKSYKRAGDQASLAKAEVFDNNQGVSNIGSEKHFSGLSLE